MNTSVTTRLQRFSSIEILESRIAPATLFAVDATGKLISFDSESPAMITSKAITGLNAAETIRGIDFRPATGELYGLGITDLAGDDEARLYVLNPATGAATLVGPGAFATLPDGLSYGFDFNPVVDRIRVVANNDLNFRLNPNTGGLVAFDTPLDNAAAAEQVVGSAYDRNFDGAPATTLFGIDFPTNNLVRQGSINGSPQSPNGGAITTIGALGVTLDSRNVGFDIESRTGTAYATLEVGGSTGLYTVNLTSGAATSLGSIGNTAPLLAFAVALPTVNIIDGKTATFTDEDGDLVTVRISKGTLSAANFQFATKENGSQLRLLKIAGADEFGGTNITITAKPATGGGSGFVNVGFIDASGVDLGNVTVAGDLGRIQAGDANTATTGLAALTTLSMGVAGTSTQLPGGNLESSIRGPVGKLVVKGDIERAAIGVTGINLADGSIGKVVIGGSIFGGSPDNSGSIITSGSVAKIVVKGNLVGSFGELSGAIQVGGSSSVVVGGSLIGGAGEGSGSLFSTGSLGKVKVGGSVSGAAGEFSGAIFAEKSLATVQIGEHLRGGAGVFSGSVGTSSGDLGKATIGGSIFGGGSASHGIFSGRTLGTVVVGGDVRGSLSAPVSIVALGQADPISSADVLTIGSVKVGGSVRFAQILAGYSQSFDPVNEDAQIGKITVGRDWVASTAAAGVDPVNGLFGDADDRKIPEITDPSGVSSAIASIVIKGQALGTGTDGDHYGFVAEQIGKLKVGARTYDLQPGPNNDVPGFAVGSTGDLRVREVPIAVV